MKKRKVQIRSCIILLVSLLLICFTNVYGYSATSNKLNTNYTLSGNGAENIYAVAKAQLGKKYPEFAGFTYRAWCADFVSACAVAANVGNVIPGAASVANLRRNIVKAGGTEHSKAEVQNGSYTPVRGDIIIFKSNGDSHVGIVDKAENRRIYYIDGNNTVYGNGNNASVHYSNRSYSYAGFTCVIRPKFTNLDPSYRDFSISKNEYKLKDKIEFFITPINTTGFGISIDKEGVGRVVAAGCNRANGHDIWANELGVGNYSAHITVYNGNKWVDTQTVWFSIVDPQPSYSNFSVSQRVYNLHDKIQFKIDPINATGCGISIDKEGVGRVVAEGCNETNGHSLWGINLGVGNYSAHITVYNDEKWIDTNTVYFSVVPPSYSNLEINKQKVGNAEDVKFKINTNHAEFMVLKIENEKGEEVYVERCSDSLDSWSVKADKLAVGQYKAYFLVFSTNDYYIETEKIPFTVYRSPEKSKLTCLPGNSYTKTIFQWEETAYTDYYDLRIDAADYEKGGNIKNVWKIKGNRCSVLLPAGEYAAHVDSVNENGAVGGDLIYFTVKEGDANHVHSYTSKVTKAATCTAAGVRTYTCKDCDSTYTKTIPATGHTKEVRNIKTATCAHAGYTGDTYCKKCNKKLATGKTVARKAHTWNKGAITTAATCTKKGVKTYTCTVCKGTKKEDIPATGHRNKVLKNARQATCAKAGYTGDTYCKDCNAKLSSGKTIAKKAHTWDAGKVTKKATCTVKGTKTYTCKICKATKTSSIAATGHRHTELRNVKKATCGQEGYTGDTYCKDCKAKVSSGKVIAKTPHKNKIVKFAKESTCKSEGYTGDIFCYDCGSLIEEGAVIDKLEHIWDSGKITVQPTAAKTGVRTYTCENCGATKKTTIPVLNLVGKTVRDKTTNGVYKVLSKTSVEYTKPIAKRAAVNIPAKVKLSGKTFNVTKISANAFRNNTVMKSLTIGSNVTTIGANAFYGCKNLNTVVIKTAKLTSKTVGANAFAKTGAKPVVTVPAKQFNTYKTLLRSKGISTKAVYKK